MTTHLTRQGKVTIRAMESKDIGAIFDIDRALLGEERSLNLMNLMTEDFGGGLDLSYVAEVNDQVAGFILARHTCIGEPVVEACLIQGLGVHPLYQEHGLGTQLVNVLFGISRGKGIKTVRIILSERDSKLERFFSYLNFQRSQQIVCDKVL